MKEIPGIKKFFIRVNAPDAYVFFAALDKHLGAEYAHQLLKEGNIRTPGERKIEVEGECVFPQCGELFNEIETGAKHGIEFELRDSE